MYYREIGVSRYAFGPLGLDPGDFLKECRDFVVVERPAIEWSERGLAVYRLAKEGVDTLTALAWLRRAARLGSVGYAGLKDANSLSVQYVTASCRDCPALVELPWGRAELVGRALSHARRGRLEANSFAVRLGGLEGAKAEDLVSSLSSERGPRILNYFGPQRFGVSRPLNSELGLMLLNRDLEGFKRALESKPELGWWERLAVKAEALEELLEGPTRIAVELAVSAYQALVFNRCLSEAAEEGRVSSKSIGLLPGLGLSKLSKLSWIDARFAECVFSSVEGDGLTEEDFALSGALRLRARARPLSVRVEGLRASSSRRGGAAIAFSLPSGSYASIFLRELFGESIEWLTRRCKRRVFASPHDY
ncbi:MAG: tRNA pseudouridine(13) synthase TruD [Fervidicoccaceae archaeon]